MGLDATITLRTDAVSWAPTDGQAVVVLDLRTSRYLSLNSSGSVLWEALDTGATEADLVRLLVARFAITSEQAAADVTSFLDMLRDRDLVTER